MKISPSSLARFNAEEVSKAAAEARKKFKIIQPVLKKEHPFVGSQARSISFRMFSAKFESVNSNGKQGRQIKRIRLPAEPLMNVQTGVAMETSTNSGLAPLHLDVRSAFQTSRAMSESGGVMVTSSPESSLESHDIHPFLECRLKQNGQCSMDFGLMGQKRGQHQQQSMMMLMLLSTSTSDNHRILEAFYGWSRADGLVKKSL
ncbi:hypothetical protein Bca4012_030235 [Brassica carinata]|uniref:Uncharacterized protein n=2 Tax=Brassica TaxID=3705 RepID=A0A0D3BU63_BRAOL|nr:PREDICTED: probable protein S-acyltransferase 22 [Brassica oleracea var. oleracea]CAF1831885.1 unnamed protein product [Brassica napus]CDY15739.1 BnaC04g15850D [Brassica napus]